MTSYYAIINLNSNSVKNRIKDIEECINQLSKNLNSRIYFDYEEAFSGTNGTWESIDIQFERARSHSHVFVFGGDGTQTYVLNLIAKYQCDLVFIGIACGTMNINPLSNHIKNITNANTVSLISQDAIKCELNNEIMSYALIDSVITTTCVALVNGNISQISAEKILNGIKEREIPKCIGGAHTTVVVKNRDATITLPQMSDIYTISAAFLSNNVKAQTIAGGADPAACAGYKWGVIIADFPLTWADANQTDLQKRPISSIFYPLNENDSVEVFGLHENAFLINDGNSVGKILKIKFSYCPSVFKVGKLSTERN